jgi:hypothetical protein
MIIAMVPVRVVQMTLDQVIDMVAVWNPFVSTTRPMDVIWLVLGTRVIWCALGRVRCAGFKDMVVDVVAVFEVQVTVVQIIDMAVVFYGDVAATGRMGMCVTFVFSARHVRSFRIVQLRVTPSRVNSSDISLPTRGAAARTADPRCKAHSRWKPPSDA